MEWFLDLLLGGLDLIYGNRWVAPFIILPAILLVAGFLHVQAIRHTKPFLAAATRRIEALQAAMGDDPDPVAERDSFARNYLDVAAAMNDKNAGSDSLVEAWRQFHETLIDESANPIRNTTRPHVFFNPTMPRQSRLTFWSNIFVGLGLILTFLGLIVALNTTARGMSTGSVTDTQTSLVLLLTVAGAKFFTSVAGLAASIWLRSAEHRISSRLRKSIEIICAQLERGLLYVSPQRLGIEQLEVLREQRDQLKFFNTDVALQLSERIGAQFHQAIAPVAASISQLNESMASVTQGIGAGAREAIEKVSGDQLRGLSDTLGTLSQRLNVIGQSVERSSGDAANQIRLAGADFAQAAGDIRGAFDRLAGQVDGMGTRLSEQSEQAARAQSESLEAILRRLQDAQTRSSGVLEQAVESLKAAGSEAAMSMQRDLGEALEQGVAESQRTFKAAVEESGQALRETSASLTAAVGAAAERVERAAAEFARSGQGAERTATAMSDVSDRARLVATSLNDAAAGFASAAAPVAQAASAVGDSANRLARIVEADRAADNVALQEMRELATGIRGVQEAAETAWRDYRARFEGVDRALGLTVEKLGDSLGDTLGEFRKFAQETDRQLAAAVGRLSGTVTKIEDYAESLDDFVRAQPTMEAAE